MRLDPLASLRRANPWWQGPGWEEKDRHLATLHRAPFAYDPRPLEGIVPGNVYTLLGPRRVGKSTAVKSHIRDLVVGGYPARRIVYYSCDLLADAQELAAFLERIYDEARVDGALAGEDVPFYLFLDEVQAVRGWQQAIKYLHDTHRLGQDCVVLTGSTARDLRVGSELLPGRRGRTLDRDRRLLPMTFRDVVRAVAPDLPLPSAQGGPRELADVVAADSSLRAELLRPRLRDATAGLIEALELYAQIGGFPGAVADYLTDRAIQQSTFLEMWDVLRGDLNRYYQVRDATIPLKILERLALNVANPVSWQKIAREADVDVKTVQAYVDLFTDAHLFLVVHRWDGGTLARHADKKIYPIDPLIAGLATAVNRRERFTPSLTLMAESLLGVALFRATELETFTPFGVQHGVLYYRTGANREVDFLVGADRIPFESKYAESVDRRDAQVMEQAFGRGVVATRRTLHLDGKTALIPTALVLATLAYR